MTDERPDGAGDRLLIAEVSGPAGVRGAVKLKSYTADPADCAAYGPLTAADGRTVAISHVSVKPNGAVIARIDGVDDRDAAEALKGLRLHVDRAALPAADEDEFYHADLIGLGVETVAGERIGVVRALHDFGAGDLLEIAEVPKARGGPTVMAPFTKAAVPVVDIAGGRVVIDPPAGLFKDAPE